MDKRPSRARTTSFSTALPAFGSQADMRGAVRRVARTCAALSAILGVIVLCGWALGIEIIETVLSGHVSMKPNTALGFLSTGIGLSFALSRLPASRTLSRIFAAITIFIGAATISEYVLGINLRIDELLFRDVQRLVEPGRPSYVTAIAFCLAGSSLFFFIGNKLSCRISQVFALLLGTLALTSITGFLYGVPVLYGSSIRANSMAFHTGIGFLVLSCGLILGQLDSAVGKVLTASERGSWVARRLLPALIIFPVLMGYLYLRPALNLGQVRFAMALFAVTLVVGGSLSLVLIGNSLNAAERRQREFMQVSMEAAAAVEISEQELRLITDNLPMLIGYIDTSGRFVRVNRTHELWLGLPANRLLGRTVSQVLGEAYWHSTRPARDAAHRGVTSSSETICPTIYGDRRVIATYAPDIDEAGDLRGFAVMVVDVEDQRRAEAALRQSEKLAAVGRHSSSIAHEINNPVDAAMNLVYLAREQVRDEEVKSLLEIADGELKRVATIVNETLRFQKRSSHSELILLADLFRSVLVLHSRRIRDNRITVDRRDRATEPFECFEGEVRQVLNNLVANALDAMLPGGRLTLRSRPATEWKSGRRGVALTIADDGKGMDESTSARVFEAFFTTKGFGGTGLGLWISAEILGRLGGKLHVRSSTSAQHHGSIFVIFLPFANAPPESINPLEAGAALKESGITDAAWG
jgi:PAS domain S-box-containing protein